MIFEIALIALTFFGVLLTALAWTGASYKERFAALLIIGLFVSLFSSPHWTSRTYLAEVMAVNKDRAGELSFSLGDSISVDRAGAKGILAPFEVAVLKAEDGRVEVLENENRIALWKFNSKALQFELESGKTYKFRVAGFGLPNIVSLEPSSPVPGCHKQGQEVASEQTGVRRSNEPAGPSP